jgi:hypothetical protein
MRELFVTQITEPGPGVAVDGTHIYWTEVGLDTIARANLNGTGRNDSFISGLAGAGGLRVDARSIYWANVGLSPPREFCDYAPAVTPPTAN